MATQPLSLEAGERLHNYFLPKGQLVLHYDVNNRVQPGVWQADLLAAMVGQREVDALAFVCPEPVSRRG